MRITQQDNDLKESLSEANDNISTLNAEVEQANSDIENLDSQIYNAQNGAWSDYETMEYTLENLTPAEDSFDEQPLISSSSTTMF